MNILPKSPDRRTILKAGLICALNPVVAPTFAADSESKMLTRPISSTGQALGVIAYGGSPAFTGNDANDPKLAQEIVSILINAGGNYIDANRNAPQKLAEFISPQILAELELAFSPYGASQNEGTEFLKGTHTLLNKSPASLVQLRFSERSEDAKRFSMMQRWKEQGLVRHIGFTGTGNYDHFEYLIRQFELDYIQVNFSLFEPGAQQRLLPLAADHGVAVVINRPFMNGDYFRRVKDLTLPEWVSDFDCESWAQFSLKYIVSHPAVTTVLTETGKPRHARDNVAAGFGRLPNNAERSRMSRFVESI